MSPRYGFSLEGISRALIQGDPLGQGVLVGRLQLFGHALLMAEENDELRHSGADDKGD